MSVADPTPTGRSATVVGVLGVGVVGDPDQGLVVANDLAFTRGDGCFEATRVEAAATGPAAVDHLGAHLDRLTRSAAALDVAIDASEWRRLVEEVVGAWGHHGEGVLRLFASAGVEGARGRAPFGVALLEPLSAATAAEREGIAVATLTTGRAIDAFAGAPWLLGGVKTLSYATNMAAARAASTAGADDALMVSADGYALEGPRSALVWRVADQLATTEVEGTGVLHSITQRAVFAGAAADGVATAYGRLPVADLPTVDGAWFLSSSRLVAPITRVDEHELAVDPAWSDRVRGWVHTSLG